MKLNDYKKLIQDKSISSTEVLIVMYLSDRSSNSKDIGDYFNMRPDNVNRTMKKLLTQNEVILMNGYYSVPQNEEILEITSNVKEVDEDFNFYSESLLSNFTKRISGKVWLRLNNYERKEYAIYLKKYLEEKGKEYTKFELKIKHYAEEFTKTFGNVD